MTRPERVIEVWGIAAGRGSTADAAPGAFTCRLYRWNSGRHGESADSPVPENDWRVILSRVEVER